MVAEKCIRYTNTYNTPPMLNVTVNCSLDNCLQEAEFQKYTLGLTVICLSLRKASMKETFKQCRYYNCFS